MGKRIAALDKSFDKLKTYSLEEGVKLVKKNATAKFDESVELHVRLGIDVKQSDQQVRGTLNLPHGIGKSKKVAVIAKGEKLTEAKAAGADLMGSEDLIEAIAKGSMDFEVLVATPDMMKDVTKLGKILGPRGLMPNPKSGTVTFDIGRTVKELKAGRVEYKADSMGIVHTVVGRASFDLTKLTENARTMLEAITKAKPQTSKGVYMKSITLTSTMGPGVHLDTAQKY